MSSEIETDNLGIQDIKHRTTNFSEEFQNSDPTVINIVDEQSKNSSVQDSDGNGSVSGNDSSHSKIKWKKVEVIDDSDSEEESNSVTDTNENLDIFKNKRHKRLTCIDSDSEEEMDRVTVHNKSFSDDTVDNNEQPVFITNSEGQLVQENIDLKKSISQAMRLSALCDSESSEDEIRGEKNIEDSNYVEEINIIPKQNKKQKPKEGAIKKPKKMTGKEAAKLRTEIKSESQRMLREKNVSLPYHKPKSYTIKEFLSKRPKLSSAIPINSKVPPSVAIKMSAEQLSLVSKKLKEREKEMKEFYKSESEYEDDDDDKDYVPPSDSINQSINNQENTEVTSGVTELQVEASSENKDAEQLQSPVSETLDTVQNPPVTSESVEEGVTKEGDSFASNVNNTGFNDCDADKNAETNNIFDNMTVDGSNEVLDQNNTSVIVTDNLNEADVQPGGKSLQDTGNNENIEYSESLRTDGVKEQCSMDYEFNLDDLEANSENILGKENPTDKRSKFEYTDLDREIENFGSDNQSSTVSTEHPKNLSKLELIKDSIANIQPRLTGCPDDVIDLETGVAKPNEVSKLMKRFVEHNFKKPVAKNKVELSIISFESGEIHKETLAVKVDDENEVMVTEEKPGAKLQKLRGELQDQMAQKRSEWWQKKTTKQPDNEETNTVDGEKEDCSDEILDDEEEEMEMTESSGSEEDDEEETNESIHPEKKKKSAFINEEAEESDEENDAIIEATSEDEEANEADDENEIDDASEYDENEEDIEADNEAETQRTNKTFKKILKGFTEDSDDEELVSKPEDINKNENAITVSQEDDIFPPHQPQNCQTPIRPITQNKSDFEFLTPISYITGLQNLNSASKNLKESPVASVFHNVNEPSPLREENWQRSLQKKLFMDTEITDSQVDELYSEQFPETQESVSLNKEQAADPYGDEFQCTSSSKENEERLVDLCSGKFPSTAEIGKRLSDQTPSTQDLLNICSGAFTGVTQTGTLEKEETVTKTPADTYLLSTNKEVKSLDEDQDMIISQLIDEEEMEKFKKRFESPLLSNTQKRIVEEFQEAQASGGVIDSDEETDTVAIKMKNKKRIMFSDDEDSEDENEEVIDLHDNVDDDEDSNIAADNIGYDSEENEIELVDGDNGRNMKPSDFFENEAKLSESEWGSADEDEKDLDAMEFEQGDTEIYDEKKIRTDLEKIHMRRMLDDDTREVKLLQEMLLEDGELHGSGRERQFKWKNIDSVTETDETKKEEDDVYLEEEESEEQWRKRRHEREMFLKTKLMKSQEVDDDDLLSESQLVKLGQKVLQRSQSNSQNNTPIDKNGTETESLVLKRSFTLSNKRGSFLSRNDQVLQRLAEYNKVTSVTLGTATAKNSRNFLFQTVTVEETSVGVKEDKKRKATDGTPNVIKKLRLTSNLSPAVKKQPTAKTKLFGNW